jgi:hypothetical protein
MTTTALLVFVWCVRSGGVLSSPLLFSTFVLCSFYFLLLFVASWRLDFFFRFASFPDSGWERIPGGSSLQFSMGGRASRIPFPGWSLGTRRQEKIGEETRKS